MDPRNITGTPLDVVGWLGCFARFEADVNKHVFAGCEEPAIVMKQAMEEVQFFALCLQYLRRDRDGLQRRDFIQVTNVRFGGEVRATAVPRGARPFIVATP